jgi:sigma-B regulation protein RsbU (phosphoserine phosphatase)
MRWLNIFSPKIIRVTFTIIALYSLGFGTYWFVQRAFINAAASDDCAWVSEGYGDTLRVIIRDIVPGGVAEKAGLQDGDVLLSINGKTFRHGLEAQEILNKVKEGDTALYVIERAGTRFEVPITIERQFNLNLVAFYVLGLFFVVIGYVVGVTKPRERVPQLFFFLSVSCMVFFNFQGKIIFPNLGFFNRVVSAVVFPAAFVHFFLHFPFTKDIVQKSRFVVASVYLMTSLQTLCVGVFAESAPAVSQLCANLFVAYIPAGFFIYLHSYTKVKSAEERKPLRVILWGSIVGILAMVYIVIYVALYRGSGITLVLYPWRSIPILFVTAIPLSFGYSIVRYRLMDIEIVVKRSLIYGIITASVAAIYLGIVFGIGNLLRNVVGENNPVLMVAAIIIIALVFDPLKQRVQHFVDRQFYRERYNYQKALKEFSQALPMLMDLDRILDSVTSSILDRMHVKSVALCLYDESGENCTTVMQKGMHGSELPFQKGPRSLASHMEVTRSPRVFYNLRYEKEPDLNPEEKVKILNSGIVLSVPMFSRDRLIGILHLGPKASEKPYSEDDIDLLQTVANQAAIAIENARLYKEEIEKQKIEEELTMARRIQQGLLPKESPKMAGLDIAGVSIPATTVGGDYFDFIKLDDRRLLVVVGDVSGKGMSAALYMSKIQGMIQLASTLYASPKDILVEVNRRIYDGIERKSFITMIIALFDLNAKRVTICRAGHNPALVASNGRVSFVKLKGLGLGLEPGLIFGHELETVEEKLEPGKLFLFYSDGLTEAMNAEREEFGEERIREAMVTLDVSSAASVQRSLIDAVSDFRGGAEQNDDVTVVVVKTL